MSTDERDPKEDPAEELRQGLGHLWKAARGVAKTMKKEVDKTNLGKAFDDAGRELARAATNVVGRISEEIGGKPKREPGPDEAPPPEGRHEGEDDDFDGVKVKPRDESPPKGPTPEDPGFRIMIDEPDKKKPE